MLRPAVDVGVDVRHHRHVGGAERGGVERLSARRFAEYLSLGQVPAPDTSGSPPLGPLIFSRSDDESNRGRVTKLSQQAEFRLGGIGGFIKSIHDYADWAANRSEKTKQSIQRLIQARELA